MSELPGFEFRVVDGDAGPYFGQGVSFTMMRFVEKRFDDVVLLRTLHGGDTWLESAAEREPYERALVALDGALRSEQESARLLSHASLRLRDPLPGNDYGDQQRHLQLVAERADLTSRAAADIVDWDEAKVSNVVNGKGGATQLEVAVLLGVCRVNAEEVAHLLSLYGETHIQGWWQQHGRCSPIRLRTVVEHLKVAKSLVSWHTHLVPLFLQTTDYLREVLRASSTAPADELAERVRAQLAMQASVGRKVKCTYFLHEFALHLRVGGAEVHAGQLLHLLFMANRPNVRIRIVPAAHGAHAGLAGPFTQLTFTKYEPLVWVQTENSSLLDEARDAIDGYETVVRALEEQSLDEAESTALITRLYESLQPARHQALTAETRSAEPFPPPA